MQTATSCIKLSQNVKHSNTAHVTSQSLVLLSETDCQQTFALHLSLLPAAIKPHLFVLPRVHLNIDDFTLGQFVPSIVPLMLHNKKYNLKNWQKQK